MSEPASVVREGLQVHRNESFVDLGQLKVGFKGGDPCQPRYESLYRYHSAPENEEQIEPAFQIASTVKTVSVGLALADENIAFVEEVNPPRPVCREVGQEGPDPALEIAYDPNDKSRCILTWTTPKDPVAKAFRIYCRRREEPFTDEHKVHGGIVLVFSTHPSGTMGKEISPPGDHEHKDHHLIYLIGADKNHRPIYDIHQSVHSQVHKDVEIEPAFRIRRKQKPLSFRMGLKIYQAEWYEKVHFPSKEGQPGELTYLLNAEKDSFQFNWNIEDPGNAPARVTPFHLFPKLPADAFNQPLPAELAEWETWENYDRALKDIGIDPTVIQLPVCDPYYGVCSYYEINE